MRRILFDSRLTGITPILNVSNEQGDARFAAVRAGEAEIFLCHGGQGSRDGRTPRSRGDDDTGGVWMSWWPKTPTEVDAAHALAVANGFTVTWPPTDEPWGVCECRIVHPDGLTFRISAPSKCE